MTIRKLRVALDLDGTADVDWYIRFCNWFNRVYGAQMGVYLNWRELKSVKFEEAIDCTPVRAGDLVFEFMNNQDHPEAWQVHDTGVRQALLEIKAIGLEYGVDIQFIIVTSRQMWAEQTATWVSQAIGDDLIVETIWTNYWFSDRAMRSKSEVCRDLGVDVLVDDRWDYVTECLGAKGLENLVAILFGEMGWTRQHYADARDNPRVFIASAWQWAPAAFEKVLWRLGYTRT